MKRVLSKNLSQYRNEVSDRVTLYRLNFLIYCSYWSGSEAHESENFELCRIETTNEEDLNSTLIIAVLQPDEQAPLVFEKKISCKTTTYKADRETMACRRYRLTYVPEIKQIELWIQFFATDQSLVYI